MGLARLSVMVSVFAALAMPALAAAQAPVEDSVVGSGVGNVPQFPVSFDIDAHSGPLGENPTGTVRFVSLSPPELRIEGPVTCLRVIGNRAVIGTNTANFGTPVFIDVTDGTPDLIGLFFPVGPLAAPCPEPGIQPSPSPILSGNVAVVDAQAMPTSKDQCKNGGWRNFGAFKNQGDCVSFVRHRARQACVFERVAHGVAAFRTKYGAGPYRLHAMRRCITQRIGP